MKKIPMRRCVATFEMCEKKELLRIVRTPEGEIVVDLTGKANGRGAYLKRSKEALEIARKKNIRRVLLSFILCQPLSFLVFSKFTHFLPIFQLFNFS